MQQRRIQQDRFVALQTVDDGGERCRGIDLCELCRDPVQPMERVAVIVFVVALDQSRRNPVERPGTTEQGAIL